MREFATINGKTYGVSLSTDTRGIYYNVNYFKKAGIEVPWEPKNWNDILVAARKIKESIPDVIPISFNVAAKGEATSMQTFLMFLYGTNDVLYKDGKWVLKSQGFLDSLRFIDTIYKEKLGAPLDVVLNAQYGNKLIYNMMPEQKVAMAIDGCWVKSAWKDKYPKTLGMYEFVAMPTQVGQSPGKTSVSGGWLLSVSAKSRNKEEAFKFIQFALNMENSLKYIQIVGNLATRTDVANMKEYPPYMKTAAGFINFTHFRPASEQYPIISPFIQKAVESVASGQATPEDAVKHYAESVTAAVGEKCVIEK